MVKLCSVESAEMLELIAEQNTLVYDLEMEEERIELAMTCKQMNELVKNYAEHFQSWTVEHVDSLFPSDSDQVTDTVIWKHENGKISLEW